MRLLTLVLLFFVAACGGGSDADPTAPGGEPEAPRPLEYNYLNRLPVPDDLTAVSESGGRAIAVGRGGTVVIREPGESSWRRVQAPTRSQFAAVHMVDAVTVVATTFEGIWSSRDGGANWKFVDDTTFMVEIAFRNGLAVIGGRSGIIFSTDLENWEPASDAPPRVTDVGFAGDDVIWAMTDPPFVSESAMYRSTDGGKNWVKFIEGSSFHAFAYAEESFGALGRGTEVQGTTNGTTFTKVLDLPAAARDIDFKTPDLGVMLTQTGHVYTSDSRGKSWNFVGQLVSDPAFLVKDIELTSAGEVLVVGSKGLIGESSGGITSVTETSSGFMEDLRAVAFGSPLVGIAASDGNRDHLFRTTDGGRSWQEVASPVALPRALAFHNQEFVLALGLNAELFRSDDLGETWADMGATSEAFTECLLILDRDTWLIGGGRFVSRTSDAGGSWTVIPTGIGVNGIDRFPGTDVLIAVGNDVVFSEDRGASWSDPVPNIVNGDEIVCLDERTAIVVSTSTIFRTTDQGLSWEAVFEPDIRDDLYGVAFLDALHGVVVGDDGMMFETIDGGQTWDQVEVTGQPLLDITLKGPGGSGVVMVGEAGTVIEGSYPEE